MKKTVLFSILLISISSKIFSQNLTFKELLDIKSYGIVQAEEFLTEKNWEFLDSVSPENDKMGMLTFGFKTKVQNKAESFLYYIFSKNDNCRISIQISNKEKYLAYLKEIKNSGAKIVDSKINNGEINKVYKNSLNVFTITTYTETSSSKSETYWQIVIKDIDE